MSDFIADLEAELRSAAHRRAARRRPRRPVALRGAVPALVVLALAVVAVALLAAPAPDDDVAVPGESVHTATTTLREAVRPVGCAGEPERQMTATPPALLELLSVLRRPQTEPDALPAAGGDRVPLGAWAPKGVRRPGRDRFATELHLVPGVGPIADGRAGCDVERPTRPPAVCLVAGPAGAARVACFADGEIANGAAAALVGGTAYGVVPDGVEEVTLEAGAATVRADVVENAYEAELPGARAGMALTVRSVFEGAGRAEGTVALLNGTTENGLGAEAQGELVERVPELLPAGGTIVSSTTSQQVEQSEVLHLAGREAEAYPIGAALGITRVREVSREELEDVGAPGSTVIAVIIGKDFRMR